MAETTRHLALRVLSEVEAGATVAERLAESDAEKLDSRERAFLHELVLGTLRARGYLDFCLTAFLDRPVRRVDARLLNLLRLGAHQIVNLRVPHRAAVSESVAVARRAAPRGAGFVNAVLRKLAAQGPPPVPDRATHPLDWLTTAGSLPHWLAERWLAALGAETACARAEAARRAPLVTCRLNPRLADAARRVEEAGVRLRALTVPGAFEVVEGAVSALAREGVLYVQDAGAQMVAHLAAAPGRVLDACASPGGKSTLLADLGASAVAAVEVSPRRLANLEALVRRWGAPGVHVVGGDSRQPPFRGLFDAALLDAPCSGLGTLSRHPDIRWKLDAAQIPRQAERQRELLDATAGLVREGGHLVYATCSLEPEENEGVVEPFLRVHEEFQHAELPAWTAGFTSPGSPYVRTLPETHGGDGFFAARLVRHAQRDDRSGDEDLW
jgi:16S rRNA (cytosine967-C5)-methyltransferase